MSQVSPFLRRLEGSYAHWCPACRELHPIAVDVPQKNGARWSFDGNVNAPTFSPSINISWGWPNQPQGLGRCHYFIRSGRIEFCGDSTHELAGRTVDLPELQQHLKDA